MLEPLFSRKRSRDETTTGTSVALKTCGIPLIGKQSNLRSLYKFSPEAKKKTPEKRSVVFKDPQEPELKKTKVTIKPFKNTGSKAEKSKVAEKAKERDKEKEKEKEKRTATGKPVGDDPKETGAAATITHEEAQGLEVVHITGLDQPLHGKRKEPEAEKLTKPAQPDAPLLLGDQVLEAPGDAPHQPPWGLKQKDTFLEFAPCRDWFLNSLPPGEVNRQRARTHNGLYHAYVVGETNTRAANHQIVREWRTMVREREEWEKYHERL
ncbi:hypothetical protein Hanom_Chr12g01159481 [Helianthus anomalus]